MMLKNFDEMEQFVLAQPAPRKAALAAAHDADALGSLLMAVDKGVAEAVLIGKKDEICALLTEMGRDPEAFTIIDESDDRAMANKAVELVHEGKADMPMKGLMHTSTFMKAILDKETGLREPDALLSQASIFEIPEKGRLLIISASGTFRKSRLDQNFTTPASGSMAPGEPMPTEAMSSMESPAASTAAREAAAIWSATASTPRGVGRLTLPRMAPSSSTTAAATLVPPKSIPKYFIVAPPAQNVATL